MVVAMIVLVGCVGAASAPDRSTVDDGAVTVGSFDFPESVLLAELYAQALEAKGFRVERQMSFGPRELLLPALARGLVELVPEYSGSALAFVGGTPTPDPVATHRELLLSLSARGLTALDASAAQDQNGFVVTGATAAHIGVRSLSDLAPFASSMVLGGPPECPERQLCLGGLEETYGLRFRQFLALDAGGPLTVEALLRGIVDVGLLFTTDGTIDRRGMVLLADDRHLQPAENVTPVIRSDLLERFGGRLTNAINAVSADLTTVELRAMNASMAAGRSPSRVARDWLLAHDLETA
jgi:osmoprotectant transport system substrate-binding protein